MMSTFRAFFLSAKPHTPYFDVLKKWGDVEWEAVKLSCTRAFISGFNNIVTLNLKIEKWCQSSGSISKSSHAYVLHHHSSIILYGYDYECSISNSQLLVFCRILCLYSLYWTHYLLNPCFIWEEKNIDKVEDGGWKTKYKEKLEVWLYFQIRILDIKIIHRY